MHPRFDGYDAMLDSFGLGHKGYTYIPLTVYRLSTKKASTSLMAPA
jgi:hypothetical protein